jgi:hypothetical protein
MDGSKIIDPLEVRVTKTKGFGIQVAFDPQYENPPHGGSQFRRIKVFYNGNIIKQYEMPNNGDYTCTVDLSDPNLDVTGIIAYKD